MGINLAQPKKTMITYMRGDRIPPEKRDTELESLPKVIRSGYPEKKFLFSGDWEYFPKLGFVPVYNSADGEILLVMWIRQSVSGKIKFLNRNRKGNGMRQCDCGRMPAIIPPSISAHSWWMCIDCKKDLKTP